MISECLQQFPVLLVTGPRQVGKTTLLQYVCKNFGYITFDDPLVLKEAIEETNLFLINNKPPLLIVFVNLKLCHFQWKFQLKIVPVFYYAPSVMVTQKEVERR